MAEKQVRVAVLMDDASFVTGAARVDAATVSLAETTASSNTKINTSNATTAEVAKKTSDAQVAALLRVREASKLRVANLSSTIAAGAGAAPGTRAAEEAAAAQVLLQRENAKLARSYGQVGVASAGFSRSSKTAEKDLNELVRGGLAGSGALSSLGRSLAFSSSGFIAFAVGAEVIKRSITGAEDLEKAQRSLGVAIQHTGGNLQKLEPRYEATAKAAAQFGIDQAEATAGLARATVLTGNAVKAQRAYEEALVISKATGKDFNVVLTAAAKGQEGITTSLRRYGILVDSSTSGTEQFTKVMQRFGGQAAANTTAAERLSASFSNALATIGVALLPTFNNLANSVANWLTKMEESGALQRDVAAGMGALKTALGPTISGFEGLAKAVGAANTAYKELKGLSHSGGLGGLLGGVPLKGLDFLKSGLETTLNPIGSLISAFSHQKQQAPVLVSGSSFFPAPFGRQGAQRGGTGPFGGAQPIPVFKSFTNTITNQIAQARAALTKSTADDVAAAKAEVALIKREISLGHLKGASLIQALQAEAGAVSTIQSAEAAAAQKAAAAAQKLKAKILARIQDSIDPLKLEVQLSKDQADNAKRAKIIHDLKALRAAARKALASGDLTLAQQKQAYDQITQLNQQIAALNKKQKDAAKTAKSAYKQVNQHKFLGGLDLTPAQRKALRQRLDQLGPGGTVGSDRTGAYGYQIGDNGRPIHVHTRVDIDGRKVAQNTTRHQQRRRRRNSSQRRGPTAGDTG